MSLNLTKIKDFLGKYYPEISYATTQDRYIRVGLDRFFDQRYVIQDNRTQMVVDPFLKGLIVIVSGNEITVSQELHDHEYIDITNSMETHTNTNPKSLYSSETFSSMAYLICQNHTMFNIVGELDEPIYIRYNSDYETFYNSVIIVNVAENIDVEIVEEFESFCAINAVINYILQPYSKLNISTFYQNHISALSFCLRNVIAQEHAKYSHILLGKGSANVLDESKIYVNNRTSLNLLGCIDPMSQEFHVVMGILPSSQDYDLLLDHRHVVSGKGKTTFTPVINGHLPIDAHTNVSSLILDQYADHLRVEKANDFIKTIIEQTTLERTMGVERFYKNKTKFLEFQ